MSGCIRQWKKNVYSDSICPFLGAPYMAPPPYQMPPPGSMPGGFPPTMAPPNMGGYVSAPPPYAAYNSGLVLVSHFPPPGDNSRSYSIMSSFQ